jgi:hypothetical protein
MARKKKIPDHILEFQDKVAKTGLTTMVEYSKGSKNWSVSVIKATPRTNICIWHNDVELKNLDLNIFWSSAAWKNYELSKEKA